MDSVCKRKSKDGKASKSKRKRKPSQSEDESPAFLSSKYAEPPVSKIYNSRFRHNTPAELFRKDLISAMKLPDSEPLSADEYVLIEDSWKPEWERGVQVPVDPDSLPEPQVREKRKRNKEINFKLPKKYIRTSRDAFFSPDVHVLNLSSSHAEQICHYDMDDVDMEFLTIVNEDREDFGLEQIDEHTMEKVIEEIESVCLENFQDALRVEAGIGAESDEDAICDVCRSPDSEEGNEIVFCDACNMCVHQSCYGIVKIPEGSWICRTCALNVRPPCLFCPARGGAMKPTINGEDWCHVSCAIWMPEVSFQQVEKMEPITKVHLVPASRWALDCALCREKVGACIQCSFKSCKVAYHVTCAFREGLKMRAIMGDDDDALKLKSFCRKHSKENPAMVSDSDNEEVNKNEIDFNDEEAHSIREGNIKGFPFLEYHKGVCKLVAKISFGLALACSLHIPSFRPCCGCRLRLYINKSTACQLLGALQTSGLQLSGLNKGSWLSAVDKIHDFNISLKLASFKELLQNQDLSLDMLHEKEANFFSYVTVDEIVDICQLDKDIVEPIFNYWKLKRRANFNQPLLPVREVNVSKPSIEENYAYTLVKRLVILRRDLERARNLCYMVNKREKLAKNWINVKKEIFMKQVEVLQDESMKLSKEEYKAVLMANYGELAYDKVHTGANGPAPNTLKVLNGLIGEENTKIQLNGILRMSKKHETNQSKRMPNPYAKHYLNGLLKRSQRWLATVDRNKQEGMYVLSDSGVQTTDDKHQEEGSMSSTSNVHNVDSQDSRSTHILNLGSELHFSHDSTDANDYKNYVIEKQDISQSATEEVKIKFKIAENFRPTSLEKELNIRNTAAFIKSDNIKLEENPESVPTKSKKNSSSRTSSKKEFQTHVKKELDGQRKKRYKNHHKSSKIRCKDSRSRSKKDRSVESERDGCLKRLKKKKKRSKSKDKSVAFTEYDVGSTCKINACDSGSSQDTQDAYNIASSMQNEETCEVVVNDLLVKEEEDETTIEVFNDGASNSNENLLIEEELNYIDSYVLETVNELQVMSDADTNESTLLKTIDLPYVEQSEFHQGDVVSTVEILVENEETISCDLHSFDLTCVKNEDSIDSSSVCKNEDSVDSSSVCKNEDSVDSSSVCKNEDSVDSSSVCKNENSVDSSSVCKNEDSVDSLSVCKNETSDSSSSSSFVQKQDILTNNKHNRLVEDTVKENVESTKPKDVPFSNPSVPRKGSLTGYKIPKKVKTESTESSLQHTRGNSPLSPLTDRMAASTATSTYGASNSYQSRPKSTWKTLTSQKVVPSVDTPASLPPVPPPPPPPPTLLADLPKPLLNGTIESQRPIRLRNDSPVMPPWRASFGHRHRNIGPRGHWPRNFVRMPHPFQQHRFPEAPHFRQWPHPPRGPCHRPHVIFRSAPNT